MPRKKPKTAAPATAPRYAAFLAHLRGPARVALAVTPLLSVPFTHALVAHIADRAEEPLAHRARRPDDEIVEVDVLRRLCQHDERHTVLGLDVQAGAHRESSAARACERVEARFVENATARKIRNEGGRLLSRRAGDQRVRDLADAVRQDVERARLAGPRAVDEKVRRTPVEHRRAEGREAALREHVVGGRIAVLRAEIASGLDERDARPVGRGQVDERRIRGEQRRARGAPGTLRGEQLFER